MNTLLLHTSTWDLTVDIDGNIAMASDPYSEAQDATHRHPHERPHRHGGVQALRHLVVQHLVKAGQGMYAYDHRGETAIELRGRWARNPLRQAAQGSH